MAIFVAVPLSAGCVVGAPRPTPRLDVARAPAARSAPDAVALPAPAGCPAPGPGEPRPPSPSPTAVWVSGHCHWDVTRYVWIEGEWREQAR